MLKTINEKSPLVSKQSNHPTVTSGRKVSRFEQDKFNEYQNFLYNRCLFGLTVYSQEEVQVMHYDKKKRITKVHKRAQTVLNLWKQSIVQVLSNYLFQAFFPDSPITKELLEDFKYAKEEFWDIDDELHINKMSLKTLKITKAQVVGRFIKEGILPKNFYELTPKLDADRIYTGQRSTKLTTKS